jgi:hypothetical protein
MAPPKTGVIVSPCPGVSAIMSILVEAEGKSHVE